MEITSVKVRTYNQENSKMRGIASVLLDGCFAIHDIRIIEREDGSFLLAMPSHKTKNGGHSDVAHPINQETRKLFEEAIITAYQNALKENGE